MACSPCPRWSTCWARTRTTPHHGRGIIVGVTALVGTLVRVRERGIEWRTGVAFGAVGVPAAYLGTLVNRNVDQPVLLIAFACLTLLAAAAMLWRGDSADDPPEHGGAGTAVATRHGVVTGAAVKIVVCGVVVGFLTGFLGVGGGFLVVPALVVVLRYADVPRGRDVPVHHRDERRVVGAVAHGGSAPRLDGHRTLHAAAIVASLVAKRVACRLSGTTLSRAFALMLGAVGLFVAAESIGMLIG